MANNNLNAITDNTKSSIKISLIGNIVDLDLDNEIEYDEISNILGDIFGRDTKYILFQGDKRLRIFIEMKIFLTLRDHGRQST
jgi:hypothetical protein